MSDQKSNIQPYAQEQLLIDALAEMACDRMLCTSAGLAQFAAAAARAYPSATITCTYFDKYRESLATNECQDSPHNLLFSCTADLPAEEADITAFPFSASGDAEFTRELIQAGHERLRLGGRMYATTDNRNDSWLRDQLAKAFSKLERRQSSAGVLYVGTKTDQLKRVRNFECEFAFRDQGRLIRAYSRPGVFSHRSIDAGARHLINEMQITPGARVLDIGCGAGVVAFAAACRTEDVHVHAVDSNCRAVQCTQRGAELNELTNLTVELNPNSDYIGAGSYDLALANPPYYSNFRIARHFLVAGRAALRAGGTILVVTKSPDWYEQHMPELFDDVTIVERKSYYLAKGVRPSD